MMAMNQDTSSAREPKDKISIQSDSDYWESEFRNTHTMEKYKPQPSINVATPPQVIINLNLLIFRIQGVNARPEIIINHSLLLDRKRKWYFI